MSLPEALKALCDIEKRYRRGERGIGLYLEALNAIVSAPIDVYIDPNKYKKEQ